MGDVAKARRQAFMEWLEAMSLNSNRVSIASGIPYNTIHSYVVGKTNSFGGDVEAQIARAYRTSVEAIFGFGLDEAGEVAREPNHLRAWRLWNNLSEEDLAKRLQTSPGVVRLMESGEYEVSPKWYRVVAPHLNTTPGHLMDYDPNDLPKDVVGLAVRMRPAKQAELARIAKALDQDVEANDYVERTGTK